MNSYEDPHLSYECDMAHEVDRLRAQRDELLAALLFIVNDAEPGEDAHLTVAGYNIACAAIAKAKG